jgi:hypothetical protein
MRITWMQAIVLGAPHLGGVLLTLVLVCGPARAGAPAELYHAEAVVTGTGEPERIRGFREGLTEVLVKLTGDHRLVGDPRLAEMLRAPARWVARFEYEDRMKNLPVHDEQGTRERPHFLRMQFGAALLNAELDRLGYLRWEDRPAVAVWLAIRTEARSYVLRSSGPEGYGQRTSLLGSAKRRGLDVVLPALTGAGESVTFDDIAAENLAELKAASKDGSALLSGILSAAEGGYWNIEWRLSHQDRSRRWSETGVTFDVALLNGLDAAALVLSGKAPF